VETSTSGKKTTLSRMNLMCSLRSFRLIHTWGTQKYSSALIASFVKRAFFSDEEVMTFLTCFPSSVRETYM